MMLHRLFFCVTVRTAAALAYASLIARDFVRTSVASIIRDIHQKKRSGLLSLSVKGANYLFKLFFREGELYCLSFKGAKNADCLAILDTLELHEAVFLSNVKLDTSCGDVPPTLDMVGFFTSLGSTVETTYFDGKGASAEAETPAPLAQSGQVVDGIKKALINQIGPVGGKLFLTALDRMWPGSMPQTPRDFENLIAALEKEIDDEKDLATFRSEVRKILSAS